MKKIDFIRLIETHTGVRLFSSDAHLELIATDDPGPGVLLKFKTGQSDFVPWSNISRATLVDEAAPPKKAKGSKN